MLQTLSCLHWQRNPDKQPIFEKLPRCLDRGRKRGHLGKPVPMVTLLIPAFPFPFPSLTFLIYHSPCDELTSEVKGIGNLFKYKQCNGAKCSQL